MKKIVILLICCLLVGCSSKQESKINEKTKKNNQPQAKTHTVKHIICINPGHQAKANTSKEKQSPSSNIYKMKVTGGTSGVSTGISESKTVLEVGLKLKEILENKGYEVVMTRTSQDINLSNQQRAKIGNEAQADLTISLHLNGIESSSANGAFTICGSNSGDTKNIYSKSNKAAKSIINAYCKETGINNQGVSYRKDLTGLNWSTVPAIYIEMGYMSNPNEDKKVTNSNFQNKMAKGIANGIDNYFNN